MASVGTKKGGIGNRDGTSGRVVAPGDSHAVGPDAFGRLQWPLHGKLLAITMIVP